MTKCLLYQLVTSASTYQVTNQPDFQYCNHTSLTATSNYSNKTNREKKLALLSNYF